MGRERCRWITLEQGRPGRGGVWGSDAIFVPNRPRTCRWVAPAEKNAPASGTDTSFGNRHQHTAVRTNTHARRSASAPHEESARMRGGMPAHSRRPRCLGPSAAPAIHTWQSLCECSLAAAACSPSLPPPLTHAGMLVHLPPSLPHPHTHPLSFLPSHSMNPTNTHAALASAPHEASASPPLCLGPSEGASHPHVAESQ